MNKLVYANTKNSDLLYFLKMNIADPFFFLENKKGTFVFLDSREFGVFNEKNKNPKISAILLDPIISDLQLSNNYSLFNLAKEIINKYGDGNKLIVSDDFPISLFMSFKDSGCDILVDNDLFFDRKVKNETEINFIKENLNKTKKTFSLIEEILEESIIKKDYLYYQNDYLTSEYLKEMVSQFLFKEKMFSSEGIIISSGVQTSMPHHPGSGKILANQPLICDIFPRSLKNNYFADMTRTYVKGKASNELKNIFNAVLKVQEEMISEIKAGENGKYFYNLACQKFNNLGFSSSKDDGFVHGLGHGLGLDVHEGPYLNKLGNDILINGNVVTVEPGLYYKNIGGVRIEDVVVIKDDSCENLTNYPKVLEIK